VGRGNGVQDEVEAAIVSASPFQGSDRDEPFAIPEAAARADPDTGLTLHSIADLMVSAR
jgi:hypothetical protein